MKEPESLETEQSFTAWHPMLVALLEHFLPAGWQLIPELLLSRLPQRVDIVVLRLVHTAAGPARKIRSIFDYLRPHTLIEHKGPTDELEAGDALVLLGYAAQYMRLKKVSDPDELCLMVVCDHIRPGFVKQVERMGGEFEAVGGGLWRGRLAGMIMHGVETRDAYRAGPSEHLLYTFARAYLTDPRPFFPLEEEDVRVYLLLRQQVKQFESQRGSMSMRDLDAAEKSYQAVYEELVKHIPPEVLRRTLTPEQRLEGLTPEQRLAGLPPEQRLEGLTPEEILNALPPEARDELARKLRH